MKLTQYHSEMKLTQLEIEKSGIVKSCSLKNNTRVYSNTIAYYNKVQTVRKK